MGDLVLAGCLILSACAGSFWLTWRLTRALPARTLNLVGILIVVSLVYYIYVIWYDIRLAALLPVSSLIILGNWLPLFASALAAVAWRSAAGSTWRQAMHVGSLLATGGLALVHPLLGEPPRCGNRWDEMGTCLQTTKRTCSPACAATLLRAHGIDATEQEMAELCLTRSGTSWQGLYRGLKLKTAGTPWDVEVVGGSTADLARIGGGPMILSVGLAEDNPRDSEFVRECGWVPGVNHSVILRGFDRGGMAVISDPSLEMCREYWDRRTLQTLWRGYAIRLVPRR
jgi:hypothetical protein